MERNEFTTVVKSNGGVSAVAKLTGFTRATVYKWMRDNGVKNVITKELLNARGINPNTLERFYD